MIPTNLEKVINVFKKNYKPIPLEKYKEDPYKILVSTLLSARTRDEMTVKVCDTKLFKAAPNFISLSKLSTSEIEKLIYPVGFYKTKAIHLKNLAQKILAEYDGKVPQEQENLMSLPGVGRKTANLVMNRAFKKAAIAVDTHVHRISNVLKWVETKNPQETELELMKILPQNKWVTINKLFVSIGQQNRTPKKLENFLRINNLIL